MSIKKAGCILLDLNSKKVGLIYRYKQKDFTFPKGHLESGETLEECAIRETEEESGHNCSISLSKKLPALIYVDSNGDTTEVFYFLAIDNGESSKKFLSELTHEIVWKDINDIEFILSHPNLVEF